MLRLYNCSILSMENDDSGNLSPIFKGEVWIKDNRIYKVINSSFEHKGLENSSNAIKPHEFSREINLNGNLIMPGFKNAHTHSPMTFLRSFADDLPLADWLNKKVFPTEAKLKPEDVYHFSKIAILEYLSSGITSVFDMYFYQEHVAKAFTECGMRAVLASPLNDFTENPQIMARSYEHFNNYHPLISYKLGFHAQYTTSMEYLQETAKLANYYKAPVYCHNSETLSEVNECISKYGTTPTSLMENMGMFNYGGGGFHCNFLSKEDIEIFKKHDLSIVSNPASNAKLASGICPLMLYLNNNINIALGTDGAASNNALDMFREMYLATVLAKLKEDDACAVDALTILKAATLGGARAMGLENADYVKEGQLADLIVIDLNQPNMQPLNNIAKNLVYSGNKSNIYLTMIDGKILYENGVYYLKDSPKNIYENARKCMEHII